MKAVAANVDEPAEDACNFRFIRLSIGVSDEKGISNYGAWEGHGVVASWLAKAMDLSVGLRAPQPSAMPQ